MGRHAGGVLLALTVVLLLAAASGGVRPADPGNKQCSACTSTSTRLMKRIHVRTFLPEMDAFIDPSSSSSSQQLLGANNNGLAHGSTAAAEMVVAAPSAAQQVYPYIYCHVDQTTPRI